MTESGAMGGRARPIAPGEDGPARPPPRISRLRRPDRSVPRVHTPGDLIIASA
jgi:hypothetical protein